MNKNTGRIKIVYLIGQLGLGGSERQLYLLLKYIDPKIFESHVVVFNPSPHLVLNDALQSIGIKVYQIPQSCGGILPRTWFLYRLFREIEPDIIHSWTIYDNPYAGLVGRLCRIPVRWGSVRGSIHHDGFQNLPAFLQWLSLKSVSKLTVNSESIIGELLEKRLSQEAIVLIQNCVDCVPPERIPDLSDYGVKKDHRLIGTVGNVRRVKNQEMFIDGMSKVLLNREDVLSLIVGQSILDESDLPEKLASRIEELGLTGKVILAGFRSDVPELLHRLSVFCLTSISEGTPNVILEAMAAARPVVATRVGGIPDLVEDNVTGFLVEPGDVDGFANAVKRLLDDPALAERMGCAGQEKVKRDYSCQAITRQLEQIYKQVIERAQ